MLAAGEAIHPTKLHKIGALSACIYSYQYLTSRVRVFSGESQHFSKCYTAGSRETSFVVESCVRGYHVYQVVWPNPVLKEALTCARERHDIFAVAVQKADSRACAKGDFMYL